MKKWSDYKKKLFWVALEISFVGPPEPIKVGLDHYRRPMSMSEAISYVQILFWPNPHETCILGQQRDNIKKLLLIWPKIPNKFVFK